MTFLPDVNILAALAVAQHTHADRARQWAESARHGEFAFCRVTQMGLLRLLTNRHVLGEDVFPAEGAWRVFDRLARETNIFFASEPAGMDQAWRDLTHLSQSGSNFWTDAYLAAFARTAGYTLVTFDRGFTKYRNTQIKLLGTEP